MTDFRVDRLVGAKTGSNRRLSCVSGQSFRASGLPDRKLRIGNGSFLFYTRHVGCGVVLAAMLKVNVSGKALTGVFNPKPHETYIGRSLLFIAIGLLQSSLICLGDLFYLNIQCQHPVYFLFAGWFTSIVYVSIIYALTVSFGDIGKAVCVVLLVMQVAGSGGTFPIEVAPDFFQKVYPLLPFTHSMNAMRECIAGFYSTVYWKELGTLALFLIPALLLGLLLRKPVIRLNDAFTEKLESTKLI